VCLFLAGWQTRWFILDNGVLAYYKSQEEVNQGCKGSMKVTACEIIGNYNYKQSYIIYVPKILNIILA
jgi:pleckstrin family protein A (phosphoinositide binding specific) protein 8